MLRYGLEKTEPFIGEGRPLFDAVCRLNLEGVIAKLEDGYGPKTWFKILNPTRHHRTRTGYGLKR